MSLPAQSEVDQEEAAERILQTLGTFTTMVFEAERAALESDGPRGLASASFTVGMTGVDPKSGPRIWVLPGLFGTIGIVSTNQTLPTQVRVACTDVRGYIAGFKGAPDLGVDPGLLARAFLQALGHKDLSTATRKRLDADLERMKIIHHNLAEGD